MEIGETFWFKDNKDKPAKLFLCRTTANIKYISYLYRKFKTYTSNTSTLLNHMIENIKYYTEKEDIVYTYLYNKGIIFIPQCPCLDYLLDCYIPKYHINIEIDERSYTHKAVKIFWD